MRQFSLRKLLLFTAVIAALLSWIGYKRPQRTGITVHVSNGHALTYDAQTGRVWREPVQPEVSE